MSSRPDLQLDWCSHTAAKYAVEHWHYSKTMPKSKLAKIGVWEHGQFIGAVIFGVGATRALVKRYGLMPEEGCELVRVALCQHHSPVSRIVSIALKMLRNEYQGLRLVVSYADPEHSHTGSIYQAGGWIYDGKSATADEYLFLGRRWQGRSFRNSYKGLEHHPSVKIIKGSSKYRYLYPLDKEIRQRILPLAKPYPKRVKDSSEPAAIHAAEGGAAPTHTLHLFPGRQSWLVGNRS